MTWSLNGEQLHRPDNTLQLAQPQRSEMEVGVDKLLGDVTDDHRARCRFALDSSSQVRGGADDRVSLPPGGLIPHLGNYHQAGVDAGPHLKLHAETDPHVRAGLGDCRNQIQGGGHRPPGIILEHPAVAEHRQHPVAEPLEHMAAEPLHRPARARL